MIKAGVNPDEHDPHGFTALILAAYNDQLQAVELLIARGADPCATDLELSAVHPTSPLTAWLRMSQKGAYPAECQ